MIVQMIYACIFSTETNGPIWDRGKSGPLSQYANHVLRDDPKRVFDVNRLKYLILNDRIKIFSGE